MIVFSVGGYLELPPAPGPDGVLAHESGDPGTATAVTLVLKFGGDARAPISALG